MFPPTPAPGPGGGKALNFSPRGECFAKDPGGEGSLRARSGLALAPFCRRGKGRVGPAQANPGDHRPPPPPLTSLLGGLVVCLAHEPAVLHEVELVSRGQLPLAHDAGEAVQVVHEVLGAAHHLRGRDAQLARGALGPEAPAGRTGRGSARRADRRAANAAPPRRALCGGRLPPGPAPGRLPGSSSRAAQTTEKGIRRPRGARRSSVLEGECESW